MKDFDIRMPKKDDKLFKARYEDWWNNAYMNAGSRDVYAEGYKRAADILVDYVDEHDSDQDFIVYPTIFLYRHAIELMLKEIIQSGSMLINVPENLRTNHDLNFHWKHCRAILEKVWPLGPKEDLENIEERIKEFSEIDPKSMTFRYPDGIKEKVSAHDLEKINLKNLQDVVKGIYNLLDGANTGISEYLDWKREMEQENRP